MFIHSPPRQRIPLSFPPKTPKDSRPAGPLHMHRRPLGALFACGKELIQPGLALPRAATQKQEVASDEGFFSSSKRTERCCFSGHSVRGRLRPRRVQVSRPGRGGEQERADAGCWRRSAVGRQETRRGQGKYYLRSYNRYSLTSQLSFLLDSDGGLTLTIT